MSMINIRHLRAFTAVAEHQHFTNAADAIHLSQPALSALVQQLEADLGVTLLHRSTRNVELTAIGAEFYEIAVKALASFDEAMTHVSDYAALRKGRVTIAALPSLAASVVPQVTRQFTSQNPRISVNVLDLPGDEVVDAVRSKRAEIGLTYLQPHVDLDSITVMHDRLVLIGQLQHIDPERTTVRWKSLCNEPIIAMTRGTTIRALTDAAAATAKVSLNVVLEPRLIQTALAFAEQGLGSAVLPSTVTTMPSLAGATNCRQYELDGPSTTREISLIRLSGTPLAPAAQQMHQHLQNYFAVNPTEANAVGGRSLSR